MTVRELIEKLRELDDELAPVYSGADFADEVQRVYYNDALGVVELR